MALFQVGTRVIMIDTQKKGIISSVLECRRGRQYYIVKWDDHESEELENELIEDCDITNIFERCKRGLFGSYSEFAQKNTSSKIQSSNNSTISSLKASKTLFRAYQFKPLLKFINSPTHRILVADEVGLGKTIEAGHIMLELKARKKLRNVFIICPKALQCKWQDELSQKFGLPFKIYESAKDVISDFKIRAGNIRAILNYEKIRYNDTEDKKTGEAKSPNYLIDYLIKNENKLSLVLCDEAHRLRNKGTHTYKGAEIIMQHAESAVLLTATPIMISNENLYNLLHLLDSSRYFNYQIFNARLQENAPFVKAITALSHRIPFNQIYKQLLHEEIYTTYSNSEDEIIYSRRRSIEEVYENDPVFQEIKTLLCSLETPKARARLSYLLNSMSVMNNIFSRTRKRDVTTDMSQPKRVPHKEKIILAEKEKEYFDEIIDEYIEDNSYTDYWGEERLTQGGALGLIQKKRQIASSVYGSMNTEENLDLGIDEYEDEEDAKFEHLIEIINEVFIHGTQKIIIFAIFRKTLKYLQIRLKKRGYTSLVIHGQIKEREAILTSFKDDPKIQILLSSEVGSEGLDMQFCDSMVNYDLPWNPMVVEQRIGRIDRFGQKSPVVNIYNFIVKDSIQEIIYDRLLDRIGIFRGTIGDMEAILDAPFSKGSSRTIQDAYNKLQRELYTNRLTEEDIQQKIDEISVAYEKELQTVEELEKGLTDTLTNDAYFKEEIDRIRNNKSYVTEEELKNYLESVIDKYLTTCNLIDCGDLVYEIKQPLSNRKAISRFLGQYRTEGSDNELSFNTFQRSLDDMNRILVTFNQEKAYDNRKLIFLNIYHPIIQACLKYFSSISDDINRTFCFSLPSDNILLAGKTYYMCIYKYVTSRKVQGIIKKSETLRPFVYDVGAQKLENDDNIINRLFSASQLSGKEYNPPSDLYLTDLVEDMRYDFLEASTQERKEKHEELRRHSESERQHNEIQTREYYNIRIENIRQRIKDIEDILEFFPPGTEERQRYENQIKREKGQMERQQRELQEKLDTINEDAFIGVECEPTSLVLLKIL